jgi:hypothetical protein
VCAALGHGVEQTGVRSTSEVSEHYVARGCLVETVRDRWCWTARVSVRRAIGYIEGRAYSFTSGVPDAAHAEAVARLRAEAARVCGPDAIVEIPNQVYFVIVRRP